jgi:hypothetical protein
MTPEMAGYPPVPRIPKSVMAMSCRVSSSSDWWLVNSMFELRDCSDLQLVAGTPQGIHTVGLSTTGTWIDIVVRAGEFFRNLGTGLYGEWHVFGAANLIRPLLQDAAAECHLGATGSIRDILDSRYPSLLPEAKDRRAFSTSFCEWLTGRTYARTVDGVVRFMFDLCP